jgi:uncharacterized OsmC-like protein
MTPDELRSLQQPLKDRYRADAGAAVVTLKASGALDDAIACSVDTGKALVKAGLHPATGGDGSLACSGDMLLQALAACAGVTMRAVATSMGITTSGHIDVEGDLDFRGTLGVDKTAPVGFRALRLRFDRVTTSSTDGGAAIEAEKRAKLFQLTERYCVVAQTLKAGVALEVRDG